MISPFGYILRDAVVQTPGAVGGVLAASDGESVDYWTELDREEWAILTAHFGILVNSIRRALHTFHFGDIQFIHMGYQKMDLVIQILENRYYVLLALEPPVQLGTAQHNLRSASALLLEEMR